jgi:hypothetical protein
VADNGKNNNLDGLSMQIMPDGRVEARLVSPDDPRDEAIYRTSQEKAAAFIANDVGPEAQKAIKGIKALKQ